MDIPAISHPKDINVWDGFSLPMLAEANHLAKKTISRDSRRYIHNAITIDPLGCKDRDDAISVFRNKDSWDVEVSVPDVQAIITPDSLLFHEAVRRVETRYYEHSNDPMFPHALSENALSLWCNRERLALTVRVRINEVLEVDQFSLDLSMLTVAQDFEYREIGQILQGKKATPYNQMIHCADVLAQALRKRRKEKDNNYEALSKIQELVGAFDDDGEPIQMHASEVRAHQLIEELMILANGAVANWARKNKIPFLFRQHIPQSEKQKLHQNLLEQAQLATAGVLPIADVRFQVRQLLGRADYSTTFAGHFGLGKTHEEPYTHFTSPIRRIVDYLNQINVIAVRMGKEVVFSKDQMHALANYINQKTKFIERQQNGYSIRPPRETEQTRVNIVKLRALESWKSTSMQTVIELLKCAFERRVSVEDAKAFIERFEMEETLDPIACAVVLLSDSAYEEGNSLLADWVIKHLSKQSTRSKEVLEQLRQYLPNWFDVRYETRRQENEFCSRAIVLIHQSPTTTHEVSFAESSKTAEQLAAAKFILDYFSYPQRVKIIEHDISDKLKPFLEEIANKRYKSALDVLGKMKPTFAINFQLIENNAAGSPAFTVQCECHDGKHNRIVKGSGKSLERAGHYASAFMLIELGYVAPNEFDFLNAEMNREVKDSSVQQKDQDALQHCLKSKDFKGALHIHLLRIGVPSAQYRLTRVDGPKHKAFYTVECLVRERGRHLKQRASRRSQFDAEQASAERMLVDFNIVSHSSDLTPEEIADPFDISERQKRILQPLMIFDLQRENYKGALQTVCQKSSMFSVRYSNEGFVVVKKRQVFKASCTLKSLCYEGGERKMVGSDWRVSKAEQLAAKQMLIDLGLYENPK